MILTNIPSITPSFTQFYNSDPDSGLNREEEWPLQVSVNKKYTISERSHFKHIMMASNMHILARKCCKRYFIITLLKYDRYIKLETVIIGKTLDKATTLLYIAKLQNFLIKSY